MPHIIVKELRKPKLPREEGDFIFTFISRGEQGVVGVEKGNYKFLLEFFPHKQGVLIKIDKSTRVPDLRVNKLALKAFATIADLEIVHSNISNLRKQREYKNLVSRDELLEKIEQYPRIWLEVGFGSGVHIANNSKKHKDILHLGIEIHKPSIEQLLIHCEIENIENIMVLSDDARVILETLPAHTLERIFVHFPVPWDKSPSKRVFSKNFIDIGSRVLVENGTLELRTDSENYYEFVFSLYQELSKFDLKIQKNHQLDIVSKYETRWRKLDKNIYDIIYTNKDITDETQEKIEFVFPKKIEDFHTKIVRFTDKGYVNSIFLVKLLKTYQIDNYTRLYKFVMGKHSFPLSIYILEKDGKLAYYPKLPFFTKENYLAHKEILKLEN